MTAQRNFQAYYKADMSHYWLSIGRAKGPAPWLTECRRCGAHGFSTIGATGRTARYYAWDKRGSEPCPHPYDPERR
jgi:hypothetical protein